MYSCTDRTILSCLLYELCTDARSPSRLSIASFHLFSVLPPLFITPLNPFISQLTKCPAWPSPLPCCSSTPGMWTGSSAGGPVSRAGPTHQHHKPSQAIRASYRGLTLRRCHSVWVYPTLGTQLGWNIHPGTRHKSTRQHAYGSCQVPSCSSLLFQLLTGRARAHVH